MDIPEIALVIDPKTEECQSVAKACELGYRVYPYTSESEDKAEALIRALQTQTYDRWHILATPSFLPVVSASELETALSSISPGVDVILLSTDGVVWEKKEEACKWGYIPGDEVIRPDAIMFHYDEIPGEIATEIKKGKSLEEVLMGGRYHPICSVNKTLFTRTEVKVPRDKRFLVCMTSYRRVRDAVRQIYTFMDQSYTNFLLQVFLKGVSEWEWNHCLRPNLQHFIDEGRLKVIHTFNAGMLEAASRFGEDIPPEDYDLMVKVDDDVWYDRDFLYRLNVLHRGFSPDVGSYSDRVQGTFTQLSGYPVFDTSRKGSFGGMSLVITKEAHACLRTYVENGNPPHILETCISSELAQENWEWREDRLLHEIMQRRGCLFRRYAENLPYSFCDGAVNLSSVTRGGWYAKAPREEILKVRAGKEEWYAMLRNGVLFRLYQGGSRLYGVVISSDEKGLLVQRDEDSAYHLFVHQPDGLYLREEL